MGIIGATIVIFALVAVVRPNLIRRAGRKFFYESAFARFFRNNWLIQILLPPITGFYYLSLDVWGDDWSIISSYKPLHTKIFISLFFFSILAAIIRGIGDWYEGISDKDYIAYLERFSTLTARVVSQKLLRFKNNIKYLKPSGNIFRAITHPKDQINVILNGWIDLLREIFKIKESAVSITIIRENPHTGGWQYLFKTNQAWRHTKAQKLMSSDSTAKKCTSTGEPQFFACKFAAAKKDQYLLSERDIRINNGHGTVFCYPAFVKTPDYEDKFVISLVTYGQRLCDPADSKHVNAIKETLIELCRRIELELTLLSIKEWQDRLQKSQSSTITGSSDHVKA